MRFRTVPGEQLKSGDGLVWRKSTEDSFRKMGLRFPDPAEALLVPARNKQTGRGEKPYVAFINGMRDAFYVCEDVRERGLDLSGHDDWDPLGEFVGVVCE